MKKVKKTSLSCEFHSNLMLVTTAVSMIAIVALMLIYIGTQNPVLASMSIATARIASVVAFVVAAVLAYRSVKTKTKYLLEYIIYLLILGFCLSCMFNLPIWAVGIIYKQFKIVNWAKLMLKVLFGITGLYFAASIAIHGFLAKRD